MSTKFVLVKYYRSQFWKGWMASPKWYRQHIYRHLCDLSDPNVYHKCSKRKPTAKLNTWMCLYYLMSGGASRNVTCIVHFKNVHLLTTDIFLIRMKSSLLVETKYERILLLIFVCHSEKKKSLHTDTQINNWFSFFYYKLYAAIQTQVYICRQTWKV